eukprot:3959717-Amphidinium_carterae.2
MASWFRVVGPALCRHEDMSERHPLVSDATISISEEVELQSRSDGARIERLRNQMSTQIYKCQHGTDKF